MEHFARSTTEGLVSFIGLAGRVTGFTIGAWLWLPEDIQVATYHALIGRTAPAQDIERVLKLVDIYAMKMSGII